jgi:hypothetical protein
MGHYSCEDVNLKGKKDSSESFPIQLTFPPGLEKANYHVWDGLWDV